jgi:hypothetical protein
MSPRNRILSLAICLFWLCGFQITAVAETYTLSGMVRDTAAHAVPSATVTAKNLATGKTYRVTTGTDGSYTIPNLAGGDYQVSAAAGYLHAPPIKVTLAAAQTTDLTVSPSPSGGR